jgi:hypothetical protein
VRALVTKAAEKRSVERLGIASAGYSCEISGGADLSSAKMPGTSDGGRKVVGVGEVACFPLAAWRCVVPRFALGLSRMGCLCLSTPLRSAQPPETLRNPLWTASSLPSATAVRLSRHELP